MKKIKLRSLTYLGGGVECRCYALSQRLVIKTYETKRGRNSAWKRQRRAYRAGIAPRTFGLLDTSRRYGYISSRASRVGTVEYAHVLVEGARRLGFVTDDLRGTNIGRWRGRLVIIDFGDMTLGS